MADPIVLTQKETELLAMRRVMWALVNAEEWLEWEDLPLLDEAGFDRVRAEVKAIEEWWVRRLMRAERDHDIDSAEVESRVS